MKYIKTFLILGLLFPTMYTNAESPIEECELNAGRTVYYEIRLFDESDNTQEIILNAEEEYSCDFENYTRFAKLKNGDMLVSPNFKEALYRLDVSQKIITSLELEDINSLEMLSLYNEPAFLSETPEYVLLANQEPYAQRADRFYIYNTQTNESEAYIGASIGIESGEKEIPATITSDGTYLITVSTLRSLNEEVVGWSVYEDNSITGVPVFSYKTESGEHFQQRSYPNSGVVVLSPNERYVIDIANPTYYHNNGVADFVIIDLDNMELLNFPYNQLPSDQKLFSKIGATNQEFFFANSSPSSQIRLTDDLYAYNFITGNIRKVTSSSERSSVLQRFDSSRSYISSDEYVTFEYEFIDQENENESQVENNDLCQIDYYRLIRYGRSGNDVAQTQQCLNNLGYDTGKVDGIYGKNTYRGIREFQISQNIKIDGIVGPQTIQYLNAQ